jgi:hypothetical protein
VGNKATDKNFKEAIEKANIDLGKVAIQMAFEVVDLTNSPYNLEKKRQLFISCAYLAPFAE